MRSIPVWENQCASRTRSLGGAGFRVLHRELQRRPCVIDGQPSQAFADRTVGDCVRHNRAYDHDPAAHHWLRSVPCVIDGP